MWGGGGVFARLGWANKQRNGIPPRGSAGRTPRGWGAGGGGRGELGGCCGSSRQAGWWGSPHPGQGGPGGAAPPGRSGRRFLLCASPWLSQQRGAHRPARYWRWEKPPWMGLGAGAEIKPLFEDHLHPYGQFKGASLCLGSSLSSN